MSEDKKEEKKGQKSSGQKSGKGTHGSLTKAGKVRSQTPKIPKTNLTKHSGPLKKNKIKYSRYLIKSKEVSENKQKRREF